jgi:hypothetical protein
MSRSATRVFTESEIEAHRRAWTAKLREPGVIQGFGALARQLTRSGPPSYCCLGVAEQTHAGVTWKRKYRADQLNDAFGPKVTLVPVRSFWDAENVDKLNAGHLTPETMRWLGLRQDNPYLVVPPDTAPNQGYGYAVMSATALNDRHRLPFTVIADLIDALPIHWNGTYAVARAIADRLEMKL